MSQTEFNLIREDIEDLKRTVEQLTKAVNRLTESCSKMDQHIDFVEGTYETLRSPLDFLARQVNRLSGVEYESELPRLE